MRFVTVTLLALSLLDPQAGQDEAQKFLDQMKALIAQFEVWLKAQQPSTGCVEPAQFQAALDGTAATVAMCPGATYGPLRVRRSDVHITTLGVPNPEARVTPAEAAGFAVVAATGNLPAFDVTGSRVAIDNVAVRGNVDTHVLCGHADGTQTTREQQPTDVTFSRLYLDGTAGAKRGVGLHCRNGTVEFSHIFGYRRAGQDTQAIAGWNGEGPFHIIDNYLEAAGENVMFGGAAPAIPGLIPRDVEIARNLFTKLLEWRAAGYTQKNLLEFKVVDGAVVDGNVFEHVWQCASVCQNGYAIVLTPQAQDAPNPNAVVRNVRITRNELRNVAAGINLLGRAQIGESLPTTGIMIADNWVRITKGFNGGASQGWFLFLSGAPSDVAVEYNTIETDSNQLLFHQGAPVLQLRYVGNLATRSGVYGFSGWDGTTTRHYADAVGVYLPGATITGNAFGSFPRPANLPGNLFMATSLLAPLVVEGRGTGALLPYGRRP